MELKEVQKLLEKFYEGISSLEEEAALHNFFLNENIPRELEPDRLYFESMEAGKLNMQPDADLTSDILQAITTPDQKKIKTRGVMTGLYPWIGAAAGLLLILGSYFFLSRQHPKDTYNDPELAYMEAQKILYYVSSKLNEGTQPLSLIEKAGRKTAPLSKMEVMNRSLNRLQEISSVSGQINRLQPFKQLQDPKGIISEYINK